MPATLNTSPPTPRLSKRPRSPSSSLPNGAPPPRRPRSSSGLKAPATPTPTPAATGMMGADATLPWATRACNWCQRCLRVLCTADPGSGAVVECAWRVDTSRCVRCRGAHRGTYDCFVAPPDLQQEAASLISLWEDAIHGVATQRQVNTAALALVDQFPAANRRAGPVRDNPRLGPVRPPGEGEEPPTGRLLEEQTVEDGREKGGREGAANGVLSDQTGVRIAKALEDLVGLLRDREERDKEKEKKQRDREKREREVQRGKEKQEAQAQRDREAEKPRQSVRDQLRDLTRRLDSSENAHSQPDSREQELRDLRRQLLSLGEVLYSTTRGRDRAIQASPHQITASGEEEVVGRHSGNSTTRNRDSKRAKPRAKAEMHRDRTEAEKLLAKRHPVSASDSRSDDDDDEDVESIPP